MNLSEMFGVGLIQLFSVSLVTFFLCWYLYFRQCFTYWKKKNIPFKTPIFPTGNTGKAMIGAQNLYDVVADIYTEFKKKGFRHAGIYFFNGPVYLPIDPEIVQCILVKDFEYFVDRGTYINAKKSPLTAHIFSMKASRLKSAYDVFLNKAGLLVEAVDVYARKGTDLNIKHVATNYTADIISMTTLGMEADALKNPESQVSKIAIRIFNPSFWEYLKMVFIDGLQNPGNILKASCNDKIVEEFFRNVVTKLIEHREKSGTSSKDFISLLLEMKKSEDLTFDEIIAQAFLFFLAGFETSSQTITFAIHALAHHPELQDKVRDEIFKTIGTDFRKYTYEDFLKLPYLDKVFNETLRLYPVLGFLNRICVKPYKIPKTDIILETGTPILITTIGFQRDPDYFPEPLKFDPERFENNESVPFSFLPFGAGPRICLGKRNGTLQTKLAIASLISKFKFYPTPKTPAFVEYDKLSTSLAMTPRKGIFVKVERL